MRWMIAVAALALVCVAGCQGEIRMRGRDGLPEGIFVGALATEASINGVKEDAGELRPDFTVVVGQSGLPAVGGVPVAVGNNFSEQLGAAFLVHTVVSVDVSGGRVVLAFRSVMVMDGESLTGSSKAIYYSTSNSTIEYLESGEMAKDDLLNLFIFRWRVTGTLTK